MSSLKVVPNKVSKVKMPVDLRDFVKSFGYRDLDHVMRKFKSFCGSFSSRKIAGCFLSSNYVYNKDSKAMTALRNIYTKTVKIVK
jgi:hypothetical protein